MIIGKYNNARRTSSASVPVATSFKKNHVRLVEGGLMSSTSHEVWRNDGYRNRKIET